MAQNLELQRAIDEQDKQIAELKRQLAEKPQEVENISAQINAENKIFLANRQLEEAGKFYYNNDLNEASALCTRAIELNSKNAAAFSIRGAIYFSSAIQLNPTDASS